MNAVRVVAAIIINTDGKILITRRKPEKSLGGYWEFPGGKVDDYEKDEEALIRELVEELNVDIIIDKFLCETSYSYDFGDIKLAFYICRLKNKNQKVISSTDHDQIEWVETKYLKDYQFAPADVEVVNTICKRWLI